MQFIDSTLTKLYNHQSLTKEEAEQAMCEIMSGKISAVKLTSWLTALKIKGETSGEIAGCASAMLQNAVKLSLKDKYAIDIVGTGGDAKHTINISTASAIVASAAGLTVAKHGNRAVSSTTGSADVLSALGINIQLSPEQMEECLDELGLCFLFAPLLHPAMKFAAPVRKEIATRTIFNILGPLCNPAGVKHLVIGVYSPELCRQIALAAKELEYKHVLVAHGNDGLDEITTTATTKVCELKNDSISEYELNPEDYGLNLAKIKDIQGAGPEHNAQILKKVFKNELKGPVKDIIVLNTASALIIGNKAENWKDGIKMANSIIESGKAYKKLEALIEFTNKFK